MSLPTVYSAQTGFHKQNCQALLYRQQAALLEKSFISTDKNQLSMCYTLPRGSSVSYLKVPFMVYKIFLFIFLLQWNKKVETILNEKLL